MIQEAVAMGNWWLVASSGQLARSCITSSAELSGETSIHPGDSNHYSPDLLPCDFWLFPKLKLPLKGKRFQTINEIQENIMGQLMAIGRTVWGSKVPTLKGTEASLSYVHCFLYLVSLSINVSIFHGTCLLHRPHIGSPVNSSSCAPSQQVATTARHAGKSTWTSQSWLLQMTSVQAYTWLPSYEMLKWQLPSWSLLNSWPSQSQAQ